MPNPEIQPIYDNYEQAKKDLDEAKKRLKKLKEVKKFGDNLVNTNKKLTEGLPKATKGLPGETGAQTKKPTEQASDLPEGLTQENLQEKLGIAMEKAGQYDSINIVMAGLQGVYLTSKMTDKNTSEDELKAATAQNIGLLLNKEGYVSKYVGSTNALLKPIKNVKSTLNGEKETAIELQKYGLKFLKGIKDLKTPAFIKNGKKGLKALNDKEVAGVFKVILKNIYRNGKKANVDELSGLDALLAIKLTQTKETDPIAAIKELKENKYGSQLYSLLTGSEYESKGDENGK